MADTTDARLEAFLRTTMRAEEVALAVTLRPADILARRSRARRDVLRRSGMRLLLVAAILALPLGALLAAGQQSPAPSPSLVAIIVRGLERQESGELSAVEVLAATPDGTETPIRTVSLAQLPPGVVGFWGASTSRDGWLLLTLDDGSIDGQVALVDLRALAATPMLLPGDSHPVWGPGDTVWLYRRAPQRIEALDPDSNESVTVVAHLSETYADSWFQVAADGTGVVIRGGSPYSCRYGQQYDDQGWVTIRESGSIEHVIAPVFDDGRPRTQSTRWGPLGISAPPMRSCPGHTELEHVSGPDKVGAYVFWPRVSRDFRGAAYQVSGDGVWMIGSVTNDGGSLYRVGPTETDALPAVAAWSGQADRYFFSAMSPDDSLIAITAETDEPFSQWHLLVDTSSGTATEVSGRIAGFLDPVELSPKSEPAR